MADVGYSGTPLGRKLGLKDGFKALFVNIPDHYFSLFSDMPDIEVVDQPEVESLDFIHLFSKSTSEFEKSALQLKPYLKMTGILWISWPKGSSKIETDLSRDPVRTFLLKNGLVDVKVCAVDGDWSGLKFMYRLKDRKR